MKPLYDTDFIVKNLPQKHPFVLVDRVLEFVPNEKIKTLKNVSVNENYFQGHFPDKKIMPGVIICEVIAQSISLFNIITKLDSSQNSDSKYIPILGGVNVKFTGTVTPGDQLVIEAKVAKSFEGMNSFLVEAFVDKRSVAKGTIFTSKKIIDNENNS